MKPSARYRFGFGLALFLAIVAAVWLTRPHEPSYQGRPLKEWLEDTDSKWGLVTEQLAAERAHIAIRAIGTNALPTLIKMYDRKDSKLKRVVLGALVNVDWFRKRLRSERDENRQGGTGLALLGTNALPVLPLIHQRRISGTLRGWDSDILTRMGPEAAPDVAALLTNSLSDIRRSVILNLSTNQFSTEAMFQLLDVCAVDPDPSIRAAVFVRFEGLEHTFRFGHSEQLDVGHMLARLKVGLKDTDAFVRDRASSAAGELGLAATDLLPQLNGLATGDPDPNVRSSAKFAVERIQAPSDSGVPTPAVGN